MLFRVFLSCAPYGSAFSEKQMNDFDSLLGDEKLNAYYAHLYVAMSQKITQFSNKNWTINGKQELV